MSMQDPVSDLLTRIRNAHAARKSEVVLPASKLKVAIVTVLKEEGYIIDFHLSGSPGAKQTLAISLKYHNGKPVIENIQRVVQDFACIKAFLSYQKFLAVWEFPLYQLHLALFLIAKQSV